MNWFIVAPPYRHTSAGIRVMHRLCHKLRELGEDACISTHIIEGHWSTPFRIQPRPDDIIVYPEIVSGNPYMAKHVVRYVLYYPGVNGGDKIYDSSEMIIYFDKKYRTTSGAIVCISPIDESLFYNDGSKKDGDLMFVGKGVCDSHRPNRYIEITNSYPTSREETARLLRSARHLFSYDTNTSLIIEAQLCGCKVYISKDGIWELAEKCTSPTWEDLTETQRLIDLTKAYFGPGWPSHRIKT